MFVRPAPGLPPGLPPLPRPAPPVQSQGLDHLNFRVDPPVVYEKLQEHGRKLQNAVETTEAIMRGVRGAAVLSGAGAFTGSASVLLGSLEMTHGVQCAREGHKLDAALNLVGGASSLIGGAATLGATFGPALFASVPLDAIGNIANGVGALADGLEDTMPFRQFPNQSPLWGVGKMMSGGIMLAAGITGNPVLQTLGTVAYLGSLTAQYNLAAADWLHDKSKPPAPDSATDSSSPASAADSLPPRR